MRSQAFSESPSYPPQFDLGGPPEPALSTIVTTLASVFPARHALLFA